MNVTVVVAQTLLAAVDGRRRLDLGVPPTADAGDVLETLFRLYPKLLQHLASERKSGRPGLTLFPMEQAPKLREGHTLLLTAAPPARRGPDA